MVRADFDDYVCGLDICALSDKGVQVLGIRSYAVDASVDDTLRRVGASLFESAHVLPLAVVVGRFPKGVRPAEVVPVGDFVGEDEEGRVGIDEAEDVGIGGGAGGAALGLEELEDGKGLGGCRGHCFFVGDHGVGGHHVAGVAGSGSFHAGGLGGGHGVAGHGGGVGHGFFGHGGFGAVLAEGLEDVLHDGGSGELRGELR